MAIFLQKLPLVRQERASIILFETWNSMRHAPTRARNIEDAKRNGFSHEIKPKLLFKEEALRGGFYQLGNGPLIVFPEESPTKLGFFELNTIGPWVISELKEYFEINGAPEITADEIFIIPVGMVGSSYLKATPGSGP